MRVRLDLKTAADRHLIRVALLGCELRAAARLGWKKLLNCVGPKKFASTAGASWRAGQAPHQPCTDLPQGCGICRCSEAVTGIPRIRSEEPDGTEMWG